VRESGLRMALTLLIIGAVCGGGIAAVNGITAPIIEERAMTEFLQALEGFFPEVENYEVQEIGNEVFYYCTDSSGNFIGVVGQVTADGYGGKISYDLAVNSSGDIIGIRISSHGETPGIGDVITTEEFQSRVIGLNYADPISPGVDVDTVSGATISSGGMLKSIRRVMDIIGENFLTN